MLGDDFMCMDLDENNKPYFGRSGHGFDTREEALAKYKEYVKNDIMPMYEKIRKQNRKRNAIKDLMEV